MIKSIKSLSIDTIVNQYLDLVNGKPKEKKDQFDKYLLILITLFKKRLSIPDQKEFKIVDYKDELRSFLSLCIEHEFVKCLDTYKTLQSIDTYTKEKLVGANLTVIDYMLYDQISKEINKIM